MTFIAIATITVITQEPCFISILLYSLKEKSLYHKYVCDSVLQSVYMTIINNDS